jgi:succinate dehydrogenase / fumarate reductase cytochrome b subunit
MVKNDKRSRTQDNRGGLIGWLNPFGYNLERYAYSLHRISGFVILIYLYFHIVVTGFRLEGPNIWESIMSSLNNPLAHAGEFIIMVFLVYHGLNGIRLGLSELGFSIGKPKRPIYPFKPSSLGRFQRMVFLIMMIIGLILLIFAATEYLLFIR